MATWPRRATGFAGHASARTHPVGFGRGQEEQPPIGAADKRTIGALLRELRRGAGYRSVDKAADVPACPASTATIYAYERGGLEQYDESSRCT